MYDSRKMGTVTYFMKIYLTMGKYIWDKIGDCPYFPHTEVRGTRLMDIYILETQG